MTQAMFNQLTRETGRPGHTVVTDDKGRWKVYLGERLILATVAVPQPSDTRLIRNCLAVLARSR